MHPLILNAIGLAILIFLVVLILGWFFNSRTTENKDKAIMDHYRDTAESLRLQSHAVARKADAQWHIAKQLERIAEVLENQK